MKMARHGWLLSMATLAVPLLLASPGAFARPAVPAASTTAHAAIESFLVGQTLGLPGKVDIRIDAPATAALPPCDAVQAFLPGGMRLWGRISVGVRCQTSPAWTRYVPAYIAVLGPYYVAARQIDFGTTLTSADVALREGDLTALPRSVIVDAVQLEGATALNPIASGAPIRRESLRGAALVQQGQNVKLVSKGAGFVVSTEGKAMTSASVGSMIQVKLQGGLLVSGKVAPSGEIERLN